MISPGEVQVHAARWRVAPERLCVALRKPSTVGSVPGNATHLPKLIRSTGSFVLVVSGQQPEGVPSAFGTHGSEVALVEGGDIDGTEAAG